jgi:integrase
VDRKVIEVAGHLYTEAPKGRKSRRTIYPRNTPAGYPLAERLNTRIEQAHAEQEEGTNPLGLVFPSPTGKLSRASNFNRTVLKPAYLAAEWRDPNGNGAWTWHSLRHVFCTTALFKWKLEATDVSCMAGHANVRTTLLMSAIRHHRRRPRPRPQSHRITVHSAARPLCTPAPPPCWQPVAC